MAAIRVFVADDRDLIRAGIRTVIACAPELAFAGETARYDQALEGIADCDPDVVIVGQPLDGGRGMSLPRVFAELRMRQRVIALVSAPTRGAVRDALLAGAHGILLADLSEAQLRRALRIVSRGQRYVDPRAATWAGGWGEPGENVIRPIELEILRHASVGRTNAAIARALSLSPHTVNARLRRIYAKLGVARRVEAVVLASRMGLLPDGEQEESGATELAAGVS